MTKVVIVGGGVVGLAVADELTRRGGLEVELLEKGPRPGIEASSAAAGILSPQGEADQPGPFLDLLLAGYQLFPEAVVRLQALTGIDMRYRAGGMLGVALSEEDEAQMERQAAWQERAGLRLERVAGSQVKSLEPAIDGPVRSAIWWPQTAQLDNTRLVEAYTRAVALQGAALRTGVPVSRFLVEGNRVVGVETPQGRIDADWVVNCAGPWAGFDRSLPFSIPTLPVKGQILQFRTDSPLVERVVKSPRAYLVQRSPQQLIVGTTVEDVGYDKEITGPGRRSILEGVGEMTSRLIGMRPETAWAGLRPGTPDRRPILGPSPLERLLLAAGHFRNGILLAPLTGRLIADWITTGGCPWDLSPFSVKRFSESKEVFHHGATQ
ncbi:MAG: glycine oxidase ThiO [Candidatus Omnitrophica bacterium]|nr:glycine oxidase ThiO [Candidatus Omnitrophota bacterium]